MPGMKMLGDSKTQGMNKRGWKQRDEISGDEVSHTREINCIQNSWIRVCVAQNAIVYCQWQAIHHCIDSSCRIAQKHDIFRWRTYREKPKKIFKISFYLFQENSIKMFKPKKSATRFKLELYISRAFPLKNWSGWDSTSVNRSNLKKYIHLAWSTPFITS